MMPPITWRAPVFSRSSACEGVSKMTLAGWNAMGLENNQSLVSEVQTLILTYPIIRSYCSSLIFGDTEQST